MRGTWVEHLSRAFHSGAKSPGANGGGGEEEGGGETVFRA